MIFRPFLFLGRIIVRSSISFLGLPSQYTFLFNSLFNLSSTLLSSIGLIGTMRVFRVVLRTIRTNTPNLLEYLNTHLHLDRVGVRHLIDCINPHWDLILKNLNIFKRLYYILMFSTLLSGFGPLVSGALRGVIYLVSSSILVVWQDSLGIFKLFRGTALHILDTFSNITGFNVPTPDFVQNMINSYRQKEIDYLKSKIPGGEWLIKDTPVYNPLNKVVETTSTSSTTYFSMYKEWINSGVNYLNPSVSDYGLTWLLVGKILLTSAGILTFIILIDRTGAEWIHHIPGVDFSLKGFNSVLTSINDILCYLFPGSSRPGQGGSGDFARTLAEQLQRRATNAAVNSVINSPNLSHTSFSPINSGSTTPTSPIALRNMLSNDETPLPVNPFESGGGPSIVLSSNFLSNLPSRFNFEVESD
jgi:hypothetical protein